MPPGVGFQLVFIGPGWGFELFFLLGGLGNSPIKKIAQGGWSGLELTDTLYSHERATNSYTTSLCSGMVPTGLSLLLSSSLYIVVDYYNNV